MTFDLEIKKQQLILEKQSNKTYEFLAKNEYVKWGASISASLMEELFEETYLNEDGYINSHWMIKFEHLKDALAIDGYFAKQTKGTVYILTLDEMDEKSQRDMQLCALSMYKHGYSLSVAQSKNEVSEEQRKKLEATQKCCARSALSVQNELLKRFSLQ